VRRHLVIAVAAAGVLVLGGCGGGDDGPSADPAGAQLFVRAGCGACHALDDAGTAGTTGPDLDAFAPTAERVRAALETGPGLMPSFTGRLSPAEIDQLAAYVDAVT
jgi:mono/diheme cytochrome c family protein